MSIKNIIRNSLKKGYLNVMVDKVVKRIKEPQLARNKQIATEWCAANAVDDTIYLQKIDASLYDEALSFNQKLHNEADEIIKKLPFKMGAGGNCILIYFLTKYYRPKTVLETGVSMGYSSYTFLELLKQYDGQLFSSDFPYFRHANPEKYVGCIVPGDLKENWHLYTKGDVVNLQEILPQVSSIDLFHYDSDKSYEGREFAFHEVRPFLKENAIIVFDDINDNLHFKDLAEKYAEEYFVLKSVNGGYVGLITKQKNQLH